MEMLRIPLCPPELKSLYFEENAEIQAFLLPTENSFNCIFAVACEEKQLFFTRFHTKFTRPKGGITLLKRQLPQGSCFYTSNASETSSDGRSSTLLATIIKKNNWSKSLWTAKINISSNKINGVFRRNPCPVTIKYLRRIS